MCTLLQRHWQFCFFKQMHVAWQPCTWSSLALVVTVTVSATSSHTFLLSNRQGSVWWLSETKYIGSCFSFSVTCSSEYRDNFLCNSHNPTMDGWNGLKEGCLYTKQPFREGAQTLFSPNTTWGFVLCLLFWHHSAAEGPSAPFRHKSGICTLFPWCFNYKHWVTVALSS